MNAPRQYGEVFFGSGLEQPERDVLLAMLCDEQSDGASTSSNKVLAERVGKSPRTVQRAIAGLRQKGLIECVYNPDLNERVRIKFLFRRTDQKRADDDGR